MGVAEVIPGVSGGTIAFITGIYERLLGSIKGFNLALLGTYRKEGVQGVWRAIDGAFLVLLLIGMGAGVVVGIFGVTYILENYPVLLWAFFFGLIIASAVYIGQQIKGWNVMIVLLLLAGAIIAFGITLITPAEGSDALPIVFIAGVIAISALILPGISGSFMLLLMGMYTIVIPAVKSALKDFDTRGIMITLVFGVGCITGLLTFANVLSWLFKKYRKQTLAVLTGFMIGSLNKIWPWRIITAWIDDDGTVVPAESVRIMTLEGLKPLREANVLPWEYTDGEPYLLLAVFFMIVGFGIVFALDRLGKGQQQ